MARTPFCLFIYLLLLDLYYTLLLLFSRRAGWLVFLCLSVLLSPRCSSTCTCAHISGKASCLAEGPFAFLKQS